MKNTIKNDIKRSLNELIKIYHDKGEGNLIFPKKRDGSIRVSEQEARFLLVKHFEETSYKYAVEAPTMQKYSFTGQKKLSGNIDICVYEDSKRCSLIELKANNYRNNHLSNDFEKLFCDFNNDTDKDKLCNFFIHILENKNPNIEEYFNKGIRIKNCNNINSNVTIFLCILKTKVIEEYKIENNQVIFVTET